MHLSNIKILNKITNKKTTFIKTGIFSAIAACWGVILVGTFITFKLVILKVFLLSDGSLFTYCSSFC